MQVMPDWSGQGLNHNSPDPYLTLNLYEFGATIRKRGATGLVSEYPVDPAAVATAFEWKPKWSTGVIPQDIIYIAGEGADTTIVNYRPPQMTGLYIDASETPMRIPLPGLVLIRKTGKNGENLQYSLFAVKERPGIQATTLFVAPLTHVYSSGGICWGTVKYQDTYNPQSPYDFSKSWEALLGSRFGNHTGTTSSMKYKADIRKMWIELEETKATEYPVDDLIIAAKTLEQAIKEMSRA